jgi:hypothetical protein
VAGEVAVRRFRRRLARMTDQRLLARLDRQIGGVRAGSAGYAYRLDLAGHRLVDPDSPGRRPWTPRPSWLGHALAVSDSYVELATTPNLKVLRFEAEPACWRAFRDGYAESVLKPDAYLEVAVAADELLVFLEVDMGTESAATLASKLDTYIRFWQAGGAEQSGGIMPLVLWAVPDDGRQLVLERLVRRQPGDAQTLHHVTKQGEVVSYLTGLFDDSSTADG